MEKKISHVLPVDGFTSCFTLSDVFIVHPEQISDNIPASSKLALNK